MKLRCYVCGKLLEHSFYLMSMNEDSDRVFVVGAECKARVDNDGVLTMRVKSS